ncbi:MAG: hypothetical protein K2K53_13390, partial [Oscillospiraceae bacterium]|nr:hypothetical protein [Oscillospiraceae bacterium]
MKKRNLRFFKCADYICVPMDDSELGDGKGPLQGLPFLKTEEKYKELEGSALLCAKELRLSVSLGRRGDIDQCTRPLAERAEELAEYRQASCLLHKSPDPDDNFYRLEQTGSGTVWIYNKGKRSLRFQTGDGLLYRVCAGTVQPLGPGNTRAMIQPHKILLDVDSGGPPNACIYGWEGNRAEEIDSEFVKWSSGSYLLDVTAGPDHYMFLRNKAGALLRQVSGPEKPVVIGNVGAEPMRVDTRMGKFEIPAGTLARLDRDAPFQREPKKVLLTQGQHGGKYLLESALLLDGGRWKPLNICICASSIQVKDGPFVVQTLRWRDNRDYYLEDPPE